jgi:cytochrome c-type protein NapB
MTPETGQKFAYLICFVVIATSIVGYFVGLQSPMNPRSGLDEQALNSRYSTDPPTEDRPFDTGVIAATHYSVMHKAIKERQQIYRTSLKDLTREIDLNAEVKITPEQKAFALALRDQNRAFNGAPPTIPHVIDQMSTASCMACHGEGFKSESLRISKMSHQFLANCTQCHVESSPSHMEAAIFGDNSFVGLPAPTGGPRAFDGAPPIIPHSTWMRVNCMSCHGLSSPQGIRTTHPWRQNCQQCHAPSSLLDQVQLETQPSFLPPPNITH